MRSKRLQSMTARALWLAVLTGSLAVAVGCVQTGSKPSQGEAGLSDDDLGLSKGDIGQVPDPLLFEINDSDPGDAPLPARAYHGSPPVINHTLEDMLPITRFENECIGCHEVDLKEPGEPTPIPESHYVDLRNAPDSRRETVAGARYQCTSCHVFQSDALPLVRMDAD